MIFLHRLLLEQTAVNTFLSMKYNESEAHKTNTCLWATWEIGKLQLLLTRFVVSKDLKS